MNLLKKTIKALVPQKALIKLKSVLYFNGLLPYKPRVYKIMYKNKTLYLSNAIDVTHWSKLDIGNNTFIWHFTILDTYNGIKIGNDCQIGTRVGIFTHSSHNSIRLYNKEYHNIPFQELQGRIKGSVEIDDNTFIGANAIIMPNTKIGKGCIVTAFSYVQGNFSDFSIIAGNPAKKVGDVRKIDYRLLKKHPELIESYLKYFNYKSIGALIDHEE
ncbi:conserved hypothetical protein [Xenorhabdus bovienii str. Jollieti]|uniref:Acyltransferase n=1 Tax=Xenorhabdus bovienii (strain SS-2004) TaxID=406818 RepID=D3V6Z5_XENBS|nr:acyltransferase [Xenorhabdus bovienii]CBJ83424.1 conserved hypothetical protein [Xenorhabdus bovienii SS-2004]CDH29314.1 conserved hypothetical protein [Xenorhabdus bovienii str. Jollieti]